MACKVLCTSLPDLLRKTILTFCEGSVKFEHCLEVTGSLHIRSDNEKVTTFLLDELVSRSSSGLKRHYNDDYEGQNEAVNLAMKPASHHGNLRSPAEAYSAPKKSRKLSRPVRKLAFSYSNSLESSDEDSDPDIQALQAKVNDPTSYRIGNIQRRMHDSLNNNDSNTSISSDETYHRPDLPPMESRAAYGESPSGHPPWEVSSTRPDDAPLSVPTSKSGDSPVPVEQEQEATNEPEQNLDNHREATPQEQPPPYEPQFEIKRELDLSKVDYNDPYLQMYKNMTANGAVDQRFSVSHLIPNLSSMVFPPTSLAGLESPLSWMLESQNRGGYHEQTNPPIIVPSSASPTASTYTSANDSQASDAGGDQDTQSSWDRTVNCQECGKVLKSLKMLQIHMNTAHTHKTIYPCKQCGKVFYAASSLHSHRKRTHTSWENKLKCISCPRTFAFQSELLRHMDMAHNISQQSLNPLNLSFEPVQPHQQNGEVPEREMITPEPPPPPPKEEVEEQIEVAEENEEVQGDMVQSSMGYQPDMVQSSMGLRYKCTDCGMLLKSKECLALHVNAKHTQKHAYPCHICGRVFYAPSSRFCHIRRVHTSSEQKFKCVYCWKVFTFHYELRNHMKMMHRSKMIAGGKAISPDSPVEEEELNHLEENQPPMEENQT